MSAFITFEGGEGSGKTTQIALLEQSFRAANIPCLRTREPGGSEGGERIRRLLVEGNADTWSPETETLLFHAARLDHVGRVIRPALATGKYVLCDRFADSTLVYQGVGKGLPEHYIRTLHTLTLGNFMPDLTLVLDISPDLGLGRAGKRKGEETRFEGMDLSFHQQVRQGFLTIAKREPQRCAVIDAERKIDDIHMQIVNAVNSRLGLTLKASS